MINNSLTPIKSNLNLENNNLKLYILSDLHLGDPTADLEKIREAINFIKETPECYCILLGDILNTALKTSKSDIYSETLNISQAQALAAELLLPIKDKILAMTPGNHENRVWREVGIDLSLWLAEKLNIQDNYRNNAIALNIQYGKDVNNNPFSLKIFGQHGAYGTGRKMGAAMNALEDLDNIVCNADIYIRAHTHSSIQGSRKVYSFNSQGNILESNKYYFNSPSFLKCDDGYGLEKGYKPQSNQPCYLNIRACSKRQGTRVIHYFKIDKMML